MRLTTLDIKGFKSFADKTSVHFNENITGVVGPNGSGKSNIVDAIRWVLGEQRTSNLRSEKMDNLIFNGSKGRKPAGLAEVSLTFENTKGVVASEFKDITITRVLHRDGESEYRLNNVSCRLKDITGLFLDTGVGSDSYAIIELKMIDEILNDREFSRRRLFEQAAGISKYKQRKKETLNKLSATDADLARVEDLLFEIGNNLKLLESQARKARKYQSMKLEYKELSIELAKMNIAQFSGTYASIETQKKEQEDRKLEIETRVTQLEAHLEQEKAKLIEKEKNLTARQKELNDLLASINKTESEKNISSEQIKFLKERKDSLEKQVMSSEEQSKQLNEKLTGLQERGEKQEQLVNEVTIELEEKNLEVAEVRKQNDELKVKVDKVQSENRELETTIHDLEKRAAVSSAQKEAFSKSISQNSTEIKEREDYLSQLKNELTGVEKEKKSKEEDLELLIVKEEERTKNLEAATKNLQEMEKAMNSENRTLDSRKNEYSLTKSLVDNLEGFPESIKFLKKNSPKTKEAQLLSDIIYCKENFRVAVENFLEPYLNYFVVADWKEALESVNLLHDASKGRANFFILDEFENYKPKETQTLPDATPAIEVVEADDKFKKLVTYLLDNVYIVNDSALEKYRSPESYKDKKLTVLSSSGKYIRKNYSLSGGALGLFEGKRLGRIRNLDKLKDEIEKLEKQKKVTESKMEEVLKNIVHLKQHSKQNDIHRLKEEIHQVGNKLISIQTKMESFKNLVEANLSKNVDIEARIKQLETETHEDENLLKTLLAKREKVTLHYGEISLQYNEINASLSQASAAYNERNIYFHQQQNLLNSILQETSFVTNQIGDLKKRVTENSEEIKLAVQRITEQETRLAELENELLKVYDNRVRFEKTLSEVEAKYYEARGEINELEETIRSQNKNKNLVDTLLSEIKDKSNELKLELTSVKERLSVEFHFDINDIIDQQPTEGLIEEEVQDKVLKIRNRLENFGEVNPMAVEAYEEMSKRNEFISIQKNDLVEAKKSLLETIEEIDKTAKEKFMEAFEKARENFKMIFQTLFNEGDTCDMILTTPDNPLEASIEIIAKPKGKKPLTINQLSGGEKSLTALAILFSLYLLKPAPFCILDEVDAPLDDTNIYKFNKVIKSFSKDSQFILVTHNKETMSSVDVIYGVTMPEMGISKVVPVDFRSLN